MSYEVGSELSKKLVELREFQRIAMVRQWEALMNLPIPFPVIQEPIFGAEADSRAFEHTIMPYDPVANPSYA
jgi:hypothetical protein